MLQIIFIIFILALPAGVTYSLAQSRDKVGCTLTIFLASIVFLALLAYVDSIFPFAGVGDDEDYYNASLTQFETLSDWFDFNRVNKFAEQGGYGMLLTWAGQFVEDSLYLRKALNVAFFLCLPAIWYSIGMSIKGRAMAVASFWIMLLTCPLWHYWMYLFKDMTIVLLQSIFLLAAVNFFSGRHNPTTILLIFLSTLLLIPFRLYLVAVNVLVLAAGFISTLKAPTRKGSKAFRLVIVSACAAAVLIAATDQSILQKLGVNSSARSLDSSALQKNMVLYEKAKQSQLQRSKLYALQFPFLFVIGETAGLNPATWGNINTGENLRGFFVIPWIFFDVPLLLVGLKGFFRRDRVTANKLTRSAHTISLEVNNKANKILLLSFIAAYIAIAWFSTDTTRWRMPAMPAMAMLAASGWVSLRPQSRALLLICWCAVLGTFATAYYLLK